MNKSAAPQSLLPTAARLPNIGLLIELGPQRRKQIKRLKRGTGSLTQQIQATVDRSREELGIDAAAEIVPVVLLYRRDQPDYVVITLDRSCRASKEMSE
jgi:hypothetical protein